MEDGMFWSWLALLLLGAWHGINPGMGWLFAVALGLQGQNRRAVVHAIPPLALGHGLAIASAVLFAALVGLILPLTHIKWLVATILVGFGLYRAIRSRHPRYGGMQVGAKDLTLWSFLMASAHGAGLMVLPFVLGVMPGSAGLGLPGVPMLHASSGASTAVAAGMGHASHAAHSAMLLSAVPEGQMVGLVATLLHTAGYLVVMGVVAVLVYEKLGLRLLRTWWFNLDLLWAATLILTGVLTPLI
jgi:hypothetical protein